MSSSPSYDYVHHLRLTWGGGPYPPEPYVLPPFKAPFTRNKKRRDKKPIPVPEFVKERRIGQSQEDEEAMAWLLSITDQQFNAFCRRGKRDKKKRP